PPPVQRPGPPVWIAAMKPRALALAARCADGWEASYLSPAAFTALSARFDALVTEAGREARAVRRSVEVDVALVESAAEAAAWRRRFCAERGIAEDDPLLGSALIGDAAAVA